LNNTVSIRPSSADGLKSGTAYTLAIVEGAMEDRCGRQNSAVRCSFTVAGTEPEPTQVSRQLFWDESGIWDDTVS
jgi:hypothetical protein